MKKNSFSFLIFICMCLLLSACSNNKSNNNALKIGIIQFVQHPALDSVTKGFMDEIKNAGLNCDFEISDANGEVSTTQTIANKLVSEKDDLIFAVATPAAQAVVGVTKDIPIVFSAVSDPKSAGLVGDNLNNVTGTSDLTPVKDQIELLRKLLPNAKTIGLLFSSAEANSAFQIDLAKKECDNLGLKYKVYSVSSLNEIQSIVESMVSNVDAIYVPTDNMIASGMSTITMIANEHKIPVIGAEKAHVDLGAVATYGIDYYELGKLSAKQAIEILKDGKKPSEIPVEYLDKSSFKLSVNKDVARKLNIDLSSVIKINNK